jgi:hypothetical protein
MTGPVTVYKRVQPAEAYLYDGTNAQAIVAWAGNHAYIAEAQRIDGTDAEGEPVWVTYDALYIITDRGDTVVEPGDHIIRGLVGEYYPITPQAYAAGWREGPA